MLDQKRKLAGDSEWRKKLDPGIVREADGPQLRDRSRLAGKSRLRHGQGLRADRTDRFGADRHHVQSVGACEISLRSDALAKKDGDKVTVGTPPAPTLNYFGVPLAFFALDILRVFFRRAGQWITPGIKQGFLHVV